jgi:hypothetical protein
MLIEYTSCLLHDIVPQELGEAVDARPKGFLSECGCDCRNLLDLPYFLECDNFLLAIVGDEKAAIPVCED